MRAEVKGLVPKYAVYQHSSREANEECRKLGAFKIEYAQDEEGRVWRRIVRAKHLGFRRFTETTRWHIADMYAWFPGADPATFDGARRQNTRARTPKREEVYLIDGKPAVFVRETLDKR